MMIRAFLTLTMLAAIVTAGMWSGRAEPSWRTSAVAAAPAETTASSIAFSREVRSDNQPVSPRTEFSGDTRTVWASFDYSDHNPNSRVTYLVRANGEDFRWGLLDCCGSNKGRFAFPVERSNGGELPGAAYDVRVYVNNAEIAQGGFGVTGRGGLDNDGQGEDNDNK